MGNRLLGDEIIEREALRLAQYVGLKDKLKVKLQYDPSSGFSVLRFWVNGEEQELIAVTDDELKMSLDDFASRIIEPAVVQAGDKYGHASWD